MGDPAVRRTGDFKCGLASRTKRVNHSKCRDRIFQAAPTLKACHGSKNGRYARLKHDLAEVVHERGGQLLCVNAELVQFKARKLAREAGAPHDIFKASCSCIQKFMHPAGFSLRQQTSIFQKLAAECEKKTGRDEKRTQVPHMSDCECW